MSMKSDLASTVSGTVTSSCIQVSGTLRAHLLVQYLIQMSVDTVLNSFSIICKDLIIILWVEGRTIHLRTLDEKD